MQASNQPYRYNGKELDRQFGLDMYDYGVRHYDAAIGRWGTVDPLGEKYYGVSPYVYCANNPVRYIDPDGRDEWDITLNGQVKWIKEGEIHTLYALDKDGNRTGKSLTLKDRAMFDNLAGTGETSNYTASYSIGNENTQADMLKTFKFASDNSNVEWRVDRFSSNNGDNMYSVGTIHNPDVAITSERMGHTTSSVTAFIHSHPDVGLSGELGSMGFSHIAGDLIFYKQRSDIDIKTNESAYQNALYYTYFPKSGNVWNVENSAKPAFIRKVNSYKGFFFGTLNTR